MTQAYLIEIEGRWYARYRKPDGKWTHKSMRASKKALAQVNFSAFLKKLEERELHFSTIRPVSLGEFFEEYLRYVKTHKSRAWHEKQKAYIYESKRARKERRVTKLLPFFGKDTLTTQVTSRKIEQYAETRRAEGARCTTINKELAAVRHAMKKAEEWGYILVNPARKVKDLPDDGKIRERFLTPDEYLLLLRDTSDSDSGPWTLPNERFTDLRELVMLGCNTGLRRSELLFLEFSDVDWERRVLRVRNKPHLLFHVKNYQERHVPLNHHAWEALRSMLHKKHPAADFVFHRSDGARWTDIHDSFKALVRRCGLGAEPPFNILAHPSAYVRIMGCDQWRFHASDPETDGAQFHRDNRALRTSQRRQLGGRGTKHRGFCNKSCNSFSKQRQKGAA